MVVDLKAGCVALALGMVMLLSTMVFDRDAGSVALALGLFMLLAALAAALAAASYSGPPRRIGDVTRVCRVDADAIAPLASNLNAVTLDISRPTERMRMVAIAEGVQPARTCPA